MIAAGPAVNIAIAFLLLAGIYWANGHRGAALARGPVTRVAGRGGPEARRRARGDRREQAGGDNLRDQNSAIAKQIATHMCADDGPGCTRPEPVTLRRPPRRELRTLRAAPVSSPGEAPLLGFTFGGTGTPPGRSRVELSAETMWDVTSHGRRRSPGIFQAEKRKEISGVVGSYETTRQSIEVSTTRALFLLAIISLSLGVINLFPFLPLDGGHIFWALAEKVRGQAIPFSVMERAGFVGFALVMVLFVIGFTNDIGRLMGEGFDVR